MNENAPGLTAAIPTQAPPTIEGVENRCDREFFNGNQDGGVAREVGLQLPGRQQDRPFSVRRAAILRTSRLASESRAAATDGFSRTTDRSSEISESSCAMIAIVNRDSGIPYHPCRMRYAREIALRPNYSLWSVAMVASPSPQLSAISRLQIHLAGEFCPYCEQPIPNEKAEQARARTEAMERELSESVTARLAQTFALEKAQMERSAKALVDQARNEGAAALEKVKSEIASREAVAREKGKKAA
jgi:hypothetical protein